MKKILLSIGFSALFLLFSGCSQKEVITSNYYPNYTKDEILLAGKYAFKTNKEYEYVVDSYRDRLEITKIGLLFYTLHHKDYILKVQEDECGTLATLMPEGSFGPDKTSKYTFSKSDHFDVWDRIDYFADAKNTFIKPTKDISECIIKNEFDNGIIKESPEDVFGELDENR